MRLRTRDEMSRSLEISANMPRSSGSFPAPMRGHVIHFAG